MQALVHKKAQAIKLRQKGYSYKEILAEVPVAKSSLSLWLKDLPLTKSEKQILKHRTDVNITRGRIKSASANRQNRLKQNNELLKIAKADFAKLSNDPLFHTGIAIYWAEGAKRNNQFLFVNSDENMIQMMILWLEKFTTYSKSDLGFRLYIHHPYIHENWEFWWQKFIGVNSTQFKKTILKPTNLGIKKSPNYKGCLRIEVPRSSKLLTTMKFWMNMQVEYHLKQ